MLGENRRKLPCATDCEFVGVCGTLSLYLMGLVCG